MRESKCIGKNESSRPDVWLSTRYRETEKNQVDAKFQAKENQVPLLETRKSRRDGKKWFGEKLIHFRYGKLEETAKWWSWNISIHVETGTSDYCYCQNYWSQNNTLEGSSEAIREEHFSQGSGKSRRLKSWTSENADKEIGRRINDQ